MTSARRRLVLKGAALGALAYTVGGAEVLLSPREALSQGLPLKALSADERATLEALTLRTADYLTKNWSGVAA